MAHARLISIEILYWGSVLKSVQKLQNGIKIGQFIEQLQYILLLPAVLNLLVGTVLR